MGASAGVTLWLGDVELANSSANGYYSCRWPFIQSNRAEGLVGIALIIRIWKKDDFQIIAASCFQKPVAAKGNR
jgi:hypothetical protein